MKYSYSTFALLVCLSVLLSSCNLPFGQTPQPPATPGLSSLEISASQTAAAPPPPSETSSPIPTDTATATETLTLTPSLEPTITETPTVGIISAKVLKETNCRTGPGGIYDRVATYQTNTQLEVVGKDLGGGYWYVQNPANPEEKCWIIGTNIEIQAGAEALPAFTPPPSPTAGPYFEVAFKNYDRCKGQYFLRFTVTNTGGFALRSGYVRVTDLKKNISVEASFNAFDLTTGCIIAKNIAPLEPGGTGYLQSDTFKIDPRVNNLRAVIMACVEKGLKPPCITHTIEIKNK